MTDDTPSTPPPVTEPVATPQEASPAPTEPEAVASESVTEAPPVEAQTAQPETQTAQIPVNEPLPPEPPPPHEATAGQSEPIPTVPESAPAPAQSAPSPTTSNATPTDSRQFASDRLVKARASIQDRKKKKIEKIMTELEKSGKITNDEVEKLLHVSDATATRYLSVLEKEGKIQQVGKTGTGVVYTKI